jgi:hypothetical protein
MNRQYIRYAAYVLVILGLIGITSEIAPVWSRYTTLGLGVLLLIIAMVKRS